MQNLITSITNITCIYPIYRSFIRKDWITMSTLSFVSAASVISHLAENHKHGMPGLFNIDPYISFLLNRADVFGSIMTISRLIWLYYQKNGINFTFTMEWILMLLPLIFLRVSEYDKYNVKLRTMYLITHSIWHLSVFLSMDYFLKNFIYV
jgi:hypothetical protein